MTISEGQVLVVMIMKKVSVSMRVVMTIVMTVVMTIVKRMCDGARDLHECLVDGEHVELLWGRHRHVTTITDREGQIG